MNCPSGFLSTSGSTTPFLRRPSVIRALLNMRFPRRDVAKMKTSRGQFFWRLARSKFSICQRKIGIGKGKPAGEQPPKVTLDEAILEEVLKKLNLDERTRLRNLSPQVLGVVNRIPLTLPFVLLRSNGCGDIELHCDHMSVLLEYILVGQSGFKVRNGAIVFTYEAAQSVITSIVSRISGITHLWLDSEWNGHIAQTIVEYFQTINSGNSRVRLQMEQLTLVGSIRSSDIEWVSWLILLSRRSIHHLRFRHCRLHNKPQAVQFWSAVSQCQNLKGLQYEPCRLDKWSKSCVIEALENKCLRSLILTGIDGLRIADVTKMATSSHLKELAVVGELLKPSAYAQKKALKMLETVENLLIQVDSTFSIDDAAERIAILRAMRALPGNGILEVIHVSRGAVSDTTKLISYWIRLARDASREVKLKLEECSQERADASVGRLLRKARDVTRTAWTKSGVLLEMDNGRLTVLDKRSWFGEHERS